LTIDARQCTRLADCPGITFLARRIMEARNHPGGAGHGFVCPVAADRFIARKRCRVIAGILFEAARQDETVLDGHDRALSEKRQHRMAGVAQERAAPFAPSLHSRTQGQRPLIGLVDIAEQRQQIGMPAAEIVQDFFGSAAHVPALDCPTGALAQADDIEKRPGAQRIVHHMAAGTDPIGAYIRGDRRWFITRGRLVVALPFSIRHTSNLLMRIPSLFTFFEVEIAVQIASWSPR
jgi:hypothetical protein